MSSVAKDLAKLIAQSTEKKVGPYDTKAVVKRVEGNTVWVAIPGGVDETPISRTIDCSKGDTVQVRVSGGTAWITGNVTDPPTSNKKAEQALNKATKAAQSAERGLTSDTIYYLASDQDSGVTIDTPGWSEEPQEITEALPYLWIYHLYTYADGRTETTEPCIVGVYGPQGDPGQDGQDGQDGTDGVSVTKVEPQYYLSTSSSSATGGSWSNSLPSYVSGRYYWTRDKITYSNGTTGYSTATYSPGLTQSVQLSYDTAQHFWTQTTGTTSVPTGAYVTEQTESAYKSSPTGGATLIRSDKVDIRVGSATYSRFDGNGTHIYDGNGTASSNVLAEFTGSGATIMHSGTAVAQLAYGPGKALQGNIYNAPYITLGERNSSYDVGNYSIASGYNNAASGYCSQAEGRNTIASAEYSHAEGIATTASQSGTHAAGYLSEASGVYSFAFGEGLKSTTYNQTVVGAYNKVDTGGTATTKGNYAFIVGNGTGTSSTYRSNAFTVGWNGAITAGGLPSGLLAEEVSIVDNLSVTTTSPTADGTKSVAKTGYTPIGIVGFRCVNASSSGTNGAYGVISHAYLSGTNNATANYRVRNCGAATMKVRIYFTVLYALG